MLFRLHKTIKFLIVSLLLMTLLGQIGATRHLEAAANQLPEPLAYFNLNEGSGSTTTSEGANQLEGTIVGATWETAALPFGGNNSGRLSFDGVDDQVIVAGPAETALNVGDALTIAAWVYPEDHETTTADIILNKEGEYELAIFPDGTLRYAIANEVYGWAWQNSAVIIPANQWSHIGFTYSAEDGVIIFYVNGVEVHRSESLSGSIGDTEPGLNELHIGGRQFGTTEYFMGMIDEVYIFDQVVEPEDIADFGCRCSSAGACNCSRLPSDNSKRNQ